MFSLLGHFVDYATPAKNDYISHIATILREIGMKITQQNEELMVYPTNILSPHMKEGENGLKVMVVYCLTRK